MVPRDAFRHDHTTDDDDILGNVGPRDRRPNGNDIFRVVSDSKHLFGMSRELERAEQWPKGRIIHDVARTQVTPRLRAPDSSVSIGGGRDGPTTRIQASDDQAIARAGE